jgi:multidrug efflux pump subunit AcrB
MTLTIDRDRAATLGVEAAAIARTMQALVGGLPVAPGLAASLDTRLLAVDAPAVRLTLAPGIDARDALALLTVPAARVGAVPLAEVVKVGTEVDPPRWQVDGRPAVILRVRGATPDATEAAVRLAAPDAGLRRVRP